MSIKGGLVHHAGAVAPDPATAISIDAATLAPMRLAKIARNFKECLDR